MRDPHFRATYGDHVAAIDSLVVLVGSLSAKALRMVREWRAELAANWERAIARPAPSIGSRCSVTTAVPAVVEVEGPP